MTSCARCRRARSLSFSAVCFRFARASCRCQLIHLLAKLHDELRLVAMLDLLRRDFCVGLPEKEVQRRVGAHSKAVAPCCSRSIHTMR